MKNKSPKNFNQTKFALLHLATPEVLGVTFTHNCQSDECADYSYQLDLDAAQVWLADSPEQAEWVWQNPSSWQVAAYGTPEHHFHPGELQVVRYEMTVTITLSLAIALPSLKEVLAAKDDFYGKPNDHLRLLQLPNADPESRQYPYNDLNLFLFQQKRPK